MPELIARFFAFHCPCARVVLYYYSSSTSRLCVVWLSTLLVEAFRLVPTSLFLDRLCACATVSCTPTHLFTERMLFRNSDLGGQKNQESVWSRAPCEIYLFSVCRRNTAPLSVKILHQSASACLLEFNETFRVSAITDRGLKPF